MVRNQILEVLTGVYGIRTDDNIGVSFAHGSLSVSVVIRFLNLRSSTGGSAQRFPNWVLHSR